MPGFFHISFVIFSVTSELIVTDEETEVQFFPLPNHTMQQYKYELTLLNNCILFTILSSQLTLHCAINTLDYHLVHLLSFSCIYLSAV